MMDDRDVLPSAGLRLAWSIKPITSYRCSRNTVTGDGV